uniref:tRNA (guanine(37)-N1)-methyltransferase n=3 Tax=Aegilops tauschii subsp. strangulata TaxID=200361 RepID=A0A453EGP5_AEGTS
GSDLLQDKLYHCSNLYLIRVQFPCFTPYSMAMPPPLLRLHPHRLLPRLRRFTSGPVLLRLNPKSLYATASTSQAAPTPPPQPPPHGPSLRRGRPTTGHPPEAPLSFSRTFDLAALRVPAAACASLERRLRGHLLNWPRVRNIARLPNDDGDGLVSLPTSPGSSSALPPTAVARREKLAREFNARGFVEFPILAKMSRPAGRTRREMKGRAAGGKETKHEKDKVYVVEVLEQGGEDDEDEWKGLVGEEGFGKGAWRGEPTRLLLLDEGHANRRVDELPEAVKVVLEHEANQGGPFAYELVQCQLTLFYDYWPMNEVTLPLQIQDSGKTSTCSGLGGITS